MSDVRRPEAGRSVSAHLEDLGHGAAYLVHSFDLLNVEHLDLVQQAAGLYGSLVVGVVPDEVVVEFLGRPPVTPMNERLELVSQVRSVDHVIPHVVGSAPEGAAILVASGQEFGVVGDVVLHPRRATTSPLLRRATAHVFGDDGVQVPA